MSLLNPNYVQSFFLAGSLSLLSGGALAQPGRESAPPAHPEGRAGIATLCIEKRSYVDYQAKRIVTPSIYIDRMPQEGIDTLYIEGGPVSQRWQEFLNPQDEEKKQWLTDTDIPDQANAAIKLVKRLDKDKNGIISPMEFEEGEKGKSSEDKLTDLAFLTSLRCDNLYFTEGALNEVDAGAFPEVQALKKDFEAISAKAAALRAEKEDLEAKSKADGATIADLREAHARSETWRKRYMAGTIASGALALGLLILLAAKSRKGNAKAPAKPEPAKAETKPEEKKTAAPNPEPAAPSAAAVVDDIEKALNEASKTTEAAPASKETPAAASEPAPAAPGSSIPT